MEGPPLREIGIGKYRVLETQGKYQILLSKSFQERVEKLETYHALEAARLQLRHKVSSGDTLGKYGSIPPSNETQSILKWREAVWEKKRGEKKEGSVVLAAEPSPLALAYTELFGEKMEGEFTLGRVKTTLVEKIHEAGDDIGRKKDLRAAAKLIMADIRKKS